MRPYIVAVGVYREWSFGFLAGECAALHLLIVEHDAELRSTLDDALSEFHSVKLVATAQEALAAQPERFDLIVTDFRMPAMSGLELNSALRERGVVVPVVLMSSDPHLGRWAMLAGFFCYLAKPFDYFQLQDVLDRVCAATRAVTT